MLLSPLLLAADGLLVDEPAAPEVVAGLSEAFPERPVASTPLEPALAEVEGEIASLGLTGGARDVDCPAPTDCEL